jgi:CDP-glucose 4,6-dehydratase
MSPILFRVPDGDFWKGRDVLVTGHTGFKGSWLSLWLARLGARVHGYALPAAAGPEGETPLFASAGVEKILASHTEADLREPGRFRDTWANRGANVLFHLAAQPLVRESYRAPLETFEVNAMGTAIVLEALRSVGRPAAAVFVTTDKVYENSEEVWGRRESDRLGGHDLYSASKTAGELLVAAYRASFFNVASADGKTSGIRVATARAGNVIGGGDWASERLVPDLARAFSRKKAAKIRKPKAVRPWQHVLEPLGAYLLLAETLFRDPTENLWTGAWNFGPKPDELWPVEALADAFRDAWGEGARWKDASRKEAFHETSFLHLSVDKARALLDWRPRWGTGESVARTARWYRDSSSPDFDANAACLKDIRDFAGETQRETS